MLEVVFNDSTKAAMKMAKRGNDIIIGTGTTYCTNKFAEFELDNRWEDQLIDGNSDDVVNIGFSLDIGDISGSLDSTKRKEVFSSLFKSLNEMEVEHFFETQREDLIKLISAAKKGMKIRIWNSNSPYSACGFAYVCDILRNIDCKISIVSLPHYHRYADVLAAYEDWRELPPRQFIKFLSYEKELSVEEKDIQANLWQGLKKENSALRAIVNGKLISVSIDFYDFLITRNIPDDEFIMAYLIGKVIGKYQLGVSDGWYALRIKNMIENKKLTIIADESHPNPYRLILRKEL